MSAKPWEKHPDSVKAAQEAKAATAKAKRSYSRSLTKDTNKRISEDVALVIAREYVKHGDLRHALVVTGFVDEDTSPSQLRKIATRVRNSKNFAAAFDHVVTAFDASEILTRERVLSGLYVEASDRLGPTSAAARVSAWGKLAQLLGMEQEAKKPPAGTDGHLEAPGGVLMVPFVQSIEQWEQSAMTQQAKLKADVRI